jgi:hypothetical protein
MDGGFLPLQTFQTKGDRFPARRHIADMLPFVYAGWKLNFYHVGTDLRARENELYRQIESIKPGLLFIHSYYGVDTWEPMRSLLAAYREKGGRVMEDVTQSYYLREGGIGADYVVGSLRKWYPIPDGGFIASDWPIFPDNIPESKEFTEKRLALLTRKWAYLHGGEAEAVRKQIKADYLEKNREAEEWLDGVSGITAMSRCAKGLLAAESEAVCRRKRNENYLALYKGFQQKGLMEKGPAPIFHERHENAAPLYFAIYAEQRDVLQAYLQERGIFAPVLWPVGKENEGYLSEAERYIFDHMLALPLDQRYGPKEMERIMEVLAEYEERKNKSRSR